MHILRLAEFPSQNELGLASAPIAHGLAATHLIHLSKELIAGGHKVSVYSGGALHSPAYELINGMSIFRTHFPQNPFYLPYSFSLAWNLRKIEKKTSNIDIINSHNPSYANAYALFPDVMPKKPLVITFHGTYAPEKRDWFFLKRLADKAHFVAISEPTISQLRSFGVSKKNISFITTGVDTNTFRPLGNKKNEILFVGRFVESKNISTLIHAFAFFSENAPNIKLRMVGDGPLFPKIKKLVSGLNLAKKVIFNSAVNHENLPAYYSAALFTVLPHFNNSFGKTVIESLACGTPVIGTNHDIPSDIMQCGIFYDYNRAQDCGLLAEKMLLLLSDSSLRLRLSSKSRNVIQKNYSWAKISKKYLDVYNYILNNRCE